MTTNTSRQPSGTPTGGQFAASARAEASVDLTEPDPFPRRPDGSIDVTAAVEQGIITGFSTETFPEPKTVSFHGHWEGNTLVVEAIYDGDVQDDRPETGYWPEGMWASSATGSSDAEIAASMLDEYEECDSLRVAVTDDEMTPDDDGGEPDECSACEEAGRVPDPDSHDSQNCWQTS